MSFAPAPKDLRGRPTAQAVRFSVTKAGKNTIIGQVLIPAVVLDELRWTHNHPLEVLIGAEEDQGWYALRPGLGDKRGHLRVAARGSGTFASRALVPPGVTEPVAVFAPSVRIEVETQTLYLKF